MHKVMEYQWNATTGKEPHMSWTIYNRESVGITFSGTASLTQHEIADLIIRLTYIKRTMNEAVG